MSHLPKPKGPEEHRMKDSRPDFFYPLLLNTRPREVLTREQVDEYFRKRGTVVKHTYIAATNPIDEDRGYGAMLKERVAKDEEWRKRKL